LTLLADMSVLNRGEKRFSTFLKDTFQKNESAGVHYISELQLHTKNEKDLYELKQKFMIRS
jgi:hypothetical protein